MEPLSANDPQVVGEFQLRARLGSGGMGRVYLGYSRAGRAVAVKVIHPELARDAEFRGRFGREVAAARAVSGMYTAPVVAAGLGDDPPWLATAFVPGPSLSDVVSANGPLPEAATWRLGAGLAEALGAVHACGLVHRDLKPANVLLAADGPHVIDFGISRAFDGTSVTVTGMVVGTPGYMSPEQAEGTQAGPASDVFSLGCVLAYAATGSPPFGTGSAASVLYRVVQSQPDLTGVPGRLRAVVEACLAKNPAQRPGLAALATMIAQAGPAISATPTSFWPASVAEVIRAASAYPTQISPAGSGAAGGGSDGFGSAGFGSAGFGTGLGSGGGLGQAAQVQAAQVHAAPLQDGYLAAATASMAARGPSVTPQTFAMPGAAKGGAWAQPGQGSWPPPAAGDPMSRYTPAPQRPRPPTPLLAAGWLMYTGAAFTLLHMLFLWTVIGKIKENYPKTHPGVPAGVAKTLADAASTEVLVIGAVIIGLWVWLAWASKHAHRWARTVGTVLFGIATYIELVMLKTPGLGGAKAIGVVIWLIGLVTVVLLWQRPSSDFFASRR